MTAASQVMVAAVVRCGTLESRNTIDVSPLPVARPLIDVEPPLVAMVCGKAVPPVGRTL